jgi:hypothetical protein
MGEPPGEGPDEGQQIVASNGHIHDDMLAVLAELYDFPGGEIRLKDAYVSSGLP